MLTIGNWEKLIDKRLLPYVISRRQLSDNQHKWWLISLISVLSIFALAGPTWERIEQPSFRTDQSLVIALDLSRSMNAQDIIPNRLTRAKLKILDILERRQGAQVALIVYSANAFTVTPLTSDTDTIIAFINSIDTSIMPIINTGIAHRKAGVGQIGAGITKAPADCFSQAVIALAKTFSN